MTSSIVSFFTEKKTSRKFIIALLSVTFGHILVIYILFLGVPAPADVNNPLAWENIEYSWSNLFFSEAFKESFIGAFIVENPLLVILLSWVVTMSIIFLILVWRSSKE
jgi:hypothetical protein